MRISIIIFIYLTSILANAETLSFLQLLKTPSKEVNLEDYLKITERESVSTLGDVLKSVQIIRSMEKLNIKNLDSKARPDKAQNIKARIDFLSKPMGTVKLTAAETMICLIALQEYYNLSYDLKDDELNLWVQKNKADLITRKQKAFEMMITHDFDVFKTSYDDMNAINKKSTKVDPDNLSPLDIQKGITELEVMKKVIRENQKCLFDSSCHYCGLSVSPKSCVVDARGRLNKILPERIDEAIIGFNKRFENLTK